MKLTVKPVALAVATLLVSAVAHAQLTTPPAVSTSPPTPGDNTSLILAIWNPTTLNGEQVDLSYTYSQLTTASGNLTPSASPTSPYTVATNPMTGTGSVLQLAWAIPSFSTVFGTGSGASYMVVAQGGTTVSGIETTYSGTLASLQTALPGAGLGVVQTALNGQSWGGETSFSSTPQGGYTIDTSGTGTANNPINGTMNGGSMDGITFSGAVNTALDFFNTVASGRSGDAISQYSNTNGAGFWFLSSAGVLSWNVPLPASTVPLPAAAWLLASGLAGLGAISRRRKIVAVA